MSSKWRLIVNEELKSPVAEAYRTLRTNISYCRTDSELKTLMFTSAGPMEGKSLTAANTAVALAQAGKKVIIVDSDLRRPVQHQIFGRKRHSGVTNFLVNGPSLIELIQETDISNLSILTSGPIPPNPSELLGSARMGELIALLRERADTVIFDVPPVIAVTDACVMASRLDGVILVLGAKTVSPEMAQKAKELILKARGCLLGVVLNRIDIETEHSYYYYYYGNERESAETGKKTVG